MALLVVVAPLLEPYSWAALVVLVALVACDAWTLVGEVPLVATRAVPERAFVGQEIEIAIEIGNAGARDVCADVFDEPADDVCVEEPFLRATRIPAGGRTRVTYRVRPQRRGNRPFASIVTIRESRLGLLRRRAVERAGGYLRVYPSAAQLHGEGLLDPSAVLVHAGSKNVRRRGEGMELESLRDYVLGDDPRRVQWSASARRGRAVVRVNQHESNHAVVLAVDTSRLMGVNLAGRSKLDYAIDASMALGLAALTHGDRVGLATFDFGIHAMVVPRASRGHFRTLVDTLQPLAPSGREANYRDLARTLCARYRRRSLVVLLTDFAEVDPESIVVPLRTLAREHRVIVAALRDPVFLGLDPSLDDSGDELSLARRLVLDDLATARETTLAKLRRGGIATIDAVPGAISAALVNRYLELRYGEER